jgi:ADP-heptose:LPS heptosyltransferase
MNISEFKKILVMRYGGIGDYVCLLPMFHALRKAIPDAEITAVIGNAGEELLGNAKVVDKIIISKTLSKNGKESILSTTAIQDFCELRAALQPPYDLYIDATPKYSAAGTFKPWLIHFLAKPKYSIGLSYADRGFYLDEKIFQDRYEAKHLIFKYAEILAKLGISAQEIIPRINTPDEYNRKADFFYSESGKKIKIGIHPGANKKYYKIKGWPLENFVELAKLISLKYNSEIFATLAPDEIALKEKLICLAGKKISLIPPCGSILELCAYLKGLDYYIANDTGPMHLATAMGVPTVGIFGHSDFETYGSYPEESFFIPVLSNGKQKNSPYISSGDPRKMSEISVSSVFSAFEKLVALKEKKQLASILHNKKSLNQRCE